VEVAWFVLVIALGIGGLILGYYLKKRRRQEMQTFAGQNGLQFSTSDPFGILGWPFALFGRGDGRGVENVVWGSWKDRDPVTVCDYWYYDQSTDSEGRTSRSYKRFHCGLLEIPAAFPHLQVARENLGTRLADLAGFEDIEFESPEFNRRYDVKASERRFAYELLDGRMLDWLVKFDHGYAYEVLGNRVLVYGKRAKPSGLISLIGTMLMFRDRIPRVAWGLYPKGA